MASRVCRLGAEPPAESSPFAVLGVLSRADTMLSRRLRRVSRDTWARPASLPRALAVRFVVRTAELTNATRAEAAEHGDVVELLAEGALFAPLGRRAGPLFSLTRWYACAVAVWPHAAFIGKADDDVWLDARGVVEHLRASLAEAERHAQTARARLYWGIIETYHWREAAHQASALTGGRRPGFHYKFRGERCARAPITANMSGAHGYRTCPPTPGEAIVGPFPFSKGPLNFLAAELAGALTSSTWARADVDATIAARRHGDGGAACEDMLPYEDAWTGMALARIAAGDGLTYMHVGMHSFAEQASGRYGAPLGPHTLFAHAHSSTITLHTSHAALTAAVTANYLARAHTTAKRLRPDGNTTSPRFACYPRPYISCNGAEWQRCLAVPPRERAAHTSPARRPERERSG
jgi:hypothetical protein